MNVTINIAGALMFGALLVVAIAVMGYSVWGVIQVRESNEQYREQLRREGYQNGVRDVAAFVFTDSHRSVGGTRTLKNVTAESAAYWIKERIWKEVQDEVEKRTTPHPPEAKR